MGWGWEGELSGPTKLRWEPRERLGNLGGHDKSQALLGPLWEYVTSPSHLQQGLLEPILEATATADKLLPALGTGCRVPCSSLPHQRVPSPCEAGGRD